MRMPARGLCQDSGKVGSMAANVETASDITVSMPKKCVHLHQYQNTGRWGAWVKDKRIKKGARLFIGTHKTKYLAARCQDRVILMIRHRFRGDGEDQPLKLNFKEVDYEDDEDLRNSLTVEAFIKFLVLESRESYKKTENKSKCLEKFLADVEQGRIADEAQPLTHTSQPEEIKDIKLEAKPDAKGKNKIADSRTRMEGESSQMAPSVSNEDMAKLFAAKQYCAICKKVWLKDEEGNFVQCDVCILWVHAPCANLTKMKMKELEHGASYHCPDCQMALSVKTSSQDQQNFHTMKLIDNVKNATSTNEDFLQSTTDPTPAKTSRRKRVLDIKSHVAKVPKTSKSTCMDIVSGCVEQTDAGPTSINAISRRMAEIDLNLPNFGNAKFSEGHQAAFILCLMKNSNNILDD